MTEQQIDLRERELDYWMARAYEAEGKLWKAEKRLAAWMGHWNATARTGAVDEVAAVLDANARADQAEARIMHLEATAQVLVKEALDAENARDESRRGKAKAVQDVLDDLEQQSPDQIGWDVAGLLPVLRRTLGSEATDPA